MKNDYKQLLSTERDRVSTNPNRNLSVESESDRARLVFSAPFRRLQQKAQVFSLEENAAVRSRLTHSFEVAQIGRFISNQICEDLLNRELLTASEARAFINFVEVACLMHDIGNPPFGHFGEAAIAKWFKDNGLECGKGAMGEGPFDADETAEEAINAALADFVEFDGNCQGLRIAALLQWNTDEFGLNLTYTSLASYLKYIRAPLFDSSPVRNIPFRKKAGFFSTERDLVERIWNHFGYSVGNPQRFPLAYIMEAADDIAYCISDLEDSLEKELLHPSLVFKDLQKLWNVILEEKFKNTSDTTAQKLTSLFDLAADSSPGDSSTFTTFRTKLSTLLTDIASNTYCNKHDEVLSGACLGLISESDPGGQALKMLKDYCTKNVYRHPIVQRPELAGLTAISGLLNHFKILINCPEERFHAAMNNENKDHLNQTILIEKKLLSLFPEKHKKAYRHGLSRNPFSTPNSKRLYEWNLRCHLITDFVSGMTDDFALSSYQMLSGIKVT